MARFSLSAYTIRVRNGDGEPTALDDVCGGKDMLDVLEAYLEAARVRAADDPRASTLLRVARMTRADRTLTGTVETGEYGYESSLYDLDHAVVSHHRTVREAEMLPFYFLIRVPQGRDEGILILQRFKQFGIRRSLSLYFHDQFDLACPDSRLEMNPLVPEQFVTEVLRNGRVTKVRFVRFRIPGDIADAFEQGGHLEEEGHLELAVVAKRNGSIPVVDRILNVVDGHTDARHLMELREFPYDTVKVEVNSGGAHRTIDLSNLRRVRAYYDITDDVRVGAGGHPEFRSIDALALRLAEELQAVIG